jgi:hypothetical protein
MRNGLLLSRKYDSTGTTVVERKHYSNCGVNGSRVARVTLAKTAFCST